MKASCYDEAIYSRFFVDYIENQAHATQLQCQRFDSRPGEPCHMTHNLPFFPSKLSAVT